MAQKTRIMAHAPCRFTNVAGRYYTHFKSYKQRKSNFLLIVAIERWKMLVTKLVKNENFSKKREKKHQKWDIECRTAE